MIVSKLSGGLGNQMFQYAAARSLAAKLQTSLKMDLSWYDEYEGNENVVQRLYELDVFGIKKNPVNRLGRLLYQKGLRTFKEKQFNFDGDFNKITGNVVLDGYWQSPKYFEGYRDIIRKDFNFKEKLHPQKNKLLTLIKQSQNPVSLHVRRGDYVKHKAIKDTYVIQPLEYYSQAIKYIAGHIKELTIFVMSDDIEWCKKNIKSEFPITFVDAIPGTNSQDMQLMTQCTHHIIANSSFSWWGAWLNRNPEKIVVAPKNWFRHGNITTVDLIPKTWIEL